MSRRRDAIKNRKYCAAYYQRNKEACATRTAIFRLNNPKKAKEYQRRSDFKQKYGITFEERDALFVAQGSCCASCKSPTTKGRNVWCVDHDHTKKKGDNGFIRGILCHMCNQAANIHHTPQTLRALADYLEAHQ